MFVALSTSSVIFIASPREAVAWGPAEVPKNSLSWVGACESDDQLDCVESVGAYINGQLVEGTLTERLHDKGSTYVDGRWVENEPDRDWWGWYNREWSIPGLVNEDGQSLVETQGTLVGPDTFNSICSPLKPSDPCLPMLQMTLTATTKDSFAVAWESGGTNCASTYRSRNEETPGRCNRAGNLQSGIRFRLVLRTSWILPSVVVAKSDQTVVTTDKLAKSGASRIAIEGIPYRTVGVGLGVDYRDKNSAASWNQVIVKANILDGRIWRNGNYASCATKPPLVVADNSWSPSSPSFDKGGGLELNVTNPHFDVDGKTEFEGRYNSVIPIETASCLWGENLSAKSQFIAEVLEKDTGEKKAATTAVSVNSEAVKINAYGFTFSSPNIRVSYVPPKAGPTITKSPKVQTITCKKGRLVRKVTSLRPKCPTGYRKA
jgi:hypothetical protein